MLLPTYPVQFSVDYPDRPLNRLTTLFRLIMAIPILIVLGAVSGGTWQWTSGQTGAGQSTAVVAAGGWGTALIRALADDRVPAEVSPLVV
jgi:hypothetical protein